MPPHDAHGLLAVLDKYEILPKAALQEVRPLADQFPAAADLARELVWRGRLTPFQVNEIMCDRAARLVLGQYLLMERLGQGGMGEVFQARHRVLDRPVALKVIRAEYLGRPDAVERFRRECRATGRLAHPHIVTVHDAHQAGDVHFLAMEYLEGKDLGRLVKERGPLPAGEACDWARQAALGLQHAHEKGMVHRDVKPANLMLTTEGMVKVLDLGLARLRAGADSGASGTDLTRAGSVMGTPDYIAPEQALGDSASADAQADVYSLGCTLFHLLAGRPPFAGATAHEKIAAHINQPPPRLEEARPGLPPGLAAVVRRMMDKSPAARHPTAGAAAAALAPYCRPAAGLSPPAGPRPGEPLPATLTLHRPGRGKRGRVRWIVAGAVLGGLAVLGLIGLWMLRPPAPTGPVTSAVLAADKNKHPEPSSNPGPGPSPAPVVAVPPVVNLPPPPQRVAVRAGVAWPPKECLGVLGETRGRHWQPVQCIAFRPDGKIIASCDREGYGGPSVLHLWDADALCERADWTVVMGTVDDLAFSPDGRTLAALCADRVLLFEAGDDGLRKPRELRPFPTNNVGSMNRLLVTPDGELLAWNSFGAVWRWRLTDHGSAEDGGLPAVASGLTPTSVRSDGRKMAFARIDGGTQKTQVVVKTIFGDPAPDQVVECNQAVNAVALSADGALLAVRAGGNPGGGVLRLWDLGKGEPEPRPDIDLTQVGYVDSPPFFCFSPDGRWIAFPSDPRRDGAPSTWLFDVNARRAVELKGHVNGITGLAFTRDARTAASCGLDHTIRLYDGDSQGFAPRAVERSAGPIRDLAFGPGGLLASVGRFGDPVQNPQATNLAHGTTRLTVWDPKTGKPISTRDSTGWFSRCAFGAGGRLLACGAAPADARKGFLRIWGPDGKEEIPAPSLPEEIRNVFLDGLALDRTGDVLILAGGPAGARRACFCDVHPFRPRGEPFQTRGDAESPTLAPDGATAAALVRKSFLSVAFWDVRDWEAGPKEVVPKHALEYASAVDARRPLYSPDGKTLASIARIGQFEQEFRDVYMWDIATGVGRTTAEQKGRHAKRVNAIAFSPDGQTLATAGEDARVVLWRAGTLEEIGEWKFPGPVYGVAFDESGALLATGDGDGTIALLRLPAPPL